MGEVVYLSHGKEVVELDDKAWDVLLAVLSAYLGAWFSKRMDEKKKTPKQPGQHFKRS